MSLKESATRTVARDCLQQRLNAARADRVPSEVQVRQRPVLLERQRQRPRARRPDAVVRQPQLLRIKSN